MENIFTIQKRLNPLIYKDNPAISTIAGFLSSGSG
jgi:hypothetical protein